MSQCFAVVSMPELTAQPNKPNLVVARSTSIQSLMKWSRAFTQTKIGGGLQNLGNSCFMNATLQCLAYLPPMTQYFMTGLHSSQCNAKEFCLLCECEQLFPHLVTGFSDTFHPVLIHHNLTRISESFNIGQQEDAHEFLQASLVSMEEALDKQMENGEHKDADESPSNLIRTLFAGETESWTQCSRCGNTTRRREPFLCLSVDVGYTLDEGLSQLTQRETMKGKDAYDCDHCRSKQEASLQTLISKLPPVFAVHIKRFRTSMNGSGFVQTQKNGQHVSFPLDLDMVTNEGSQFEYELRGLIVHRGDDAFSGHYYAIVRGCDGGWYRMDDNYVTAVSIGEVLNQDVYILFYTRKIIEGDMDESMEAVDVPEDTEWVSDDSVSSVSGSEDDEDGGWVGIDDALVAPMDWVNGGWLS